MYNKINCILVEAALLTTGFILGVVVVLGVGFLMGALTTTLFVRGLKSREDAEKLEDALKSKGFDALTTVWHEHSTGKLAVQVGEKAYLNPAKIAPDQRQALIDLGRNLLNWLGVAEHPVAPPAPKPVITPAPEPPQRPQIPMPLTPVPVVDPEVPKKGPTTMVGQIDEILQRLLASNTSLAHRGVRLMEVPPAGVVVWVGLERFDGLDAVPYPDVKQVIQAAVDEWEKEHGGK